MVTGMKNRALLAERRTMAAGCIPGSPAHGSPAVYDPSTDGHLVIEAPPGTGIGKVWAGMANALSPDWDVFVADIFGGYDGDGVPPLAAGAAHTFEDIADLLERVQALALERAAGTGPLSAGQGILLVVDDARHILGEWPGSPRFEREARNRSVAAFGSIAAHALAARVTIIVASRQPLGPTLPEAFGTASKITLAGGGPNAFHRLPAHGRWLYRRAGGNPDPITALRH